MSRVQLTTSGLAVAMLFVAHAAAQAPDAPRPPFQPDDRVAVELAAPPTVKLGDPIRVTFKLTNQSKQRLQILKWGTPLEGWKDNMFVVKLDDRELPCLAPLGKKVAKPSPEFYVQLDPGQSTTATVDFTAPRAYRIDKPGVLTIAFRNHLVDVFAGDREALATRTARTHSMVASNALKITID